MAASVVPEASSVGAFLRAAGLARFVSREAGRGKTLTLFGLYVFTTRLERVGLTLVVPVAESVRTDGTVTVQVRAVFGRLSPPRSDSGK